MPATAPASMRARPSRLRCAWSSAIWAALCPTSRHRGPPGSAGNSGKLCQVLINLLTNAAHAVSGLPGDRQRIGIRIATRKREVEIQVEDRGAGISPEVLPRIFDPLFTTKGTLGTGLGLYLSSQIVNELGGRLEVETKQGEGTRFSVILPSAGRRRRSDPAPARAARGTSLTSHLGRKAVGNAALT